MKHLKNILFLSAMIVLSLQLVFVTNAAEKVNGDGAINVSLQHIAPNENKDTIAFYTDSAMGGYLNISPDNLVVDKENVKVVISVPKKMLAKELGRPFAIPDFNSTYPHTISELKDDGTNYRIEITFEKYDKSQALSIPGIL